MKVKTTCYDVCRIDQQALLLKIPSEPGNGLVVVLIYRPGVAYRKAGLDGSARINYHKLCDALGGTRVNLRGGLAG